MATAVNLAGVEKKFQSLSNTQDGIQSMALWVIHHKANHEKIVDVWFKVLKKAKLPQRLTLFYLCNEVVQTCKKKHAIIYKDAFKEVLKDAVLLVRDASIKNNVERIFKIWEERGIYDKEFLAELSSLISNSKVRAAMGSRLLAEFKPQKLIDRIMEVDQVQKRAALKHTQVAHIKLDASTVETVRQLKDKTHGKEYSQQFEENCVKVEELVTLLEHETKARTTVIELLEQSELFYDTQYGEVKLVANAYKNFGARVNTIKKRLEEHIKTLPDPFEDPVPSPNMDAPSPESHTPPDLIQDNTDQVDMEMSDDEDINTAHSEKKKGAKHSSSSDRQNFEVEDGSPQKRNPKIKMNMPSYASFLESLTSDHQNTDPYKGSQHGGLAWSPSKGLVSVNTDGQTEPLANEGFDKAANVTAGDSTPVKDEPGEEGGSTPLQDEQEAKLESEEQSANSVANPIEFLRQFLSQSQKAGGSSHLLQGLSALTQNVVSQYDGGKPGQTSSTQSQSDHVMEPVPTPPMSEPPIPPASLAPVNDWQGWKDQQPETVVSPSMPTFSPRPPYQQQPPPPPIMQAPVMPPAPVQGQMNMQNQPGENAPMSAPPPPPLALSINPWQQPVQHSSQPTPDLTPYNPDMAYQDYGAEEPDDVSGHPDNHLTPSLLRHHRSNSNNLKTITPTDDFENGQDGETSPIPTIGGRSNRQFMPFQARAAPSVNQSPAGGTQVSDEQQEFIDKLKRRTSIPTSPVLSGIGNVHSSNLRNLTPVKTEDEHYEHTSNDISVAPLLNSMSLARESVPADSVMKVGPTPLLETAHQIGTIQSSWNPADDFSKPPSSSLEADHDLSNLGSLQEFNLSPVQHVPVTDYGHGRPPFDSFDQRPAFRGGNQNYRPVHPRDPYYDYRDAPYRRPRPFLKRPPPQFAPRHAYYPRF